MKQILIVEDEYFLATDLQISLQECGITVLGPVGTLPDAIQIARSTRVDLAIMDVNLHGQMAFDLADMLHDAGVPILIATGYNRDALPERLRRHRLVEKPYAMTQMLAVIGEMLGERMR